MDKEKILIVAYNDLGNGGIQNVIMNTVRHLSNEFTFDIVCFDSLRTDFNDEFKSFGGKIFVARSKGNAGLFKKLEFYTAGHRLYSDIKKIILDNGPYIAVHSHKEILSGPVLRAAAKCNVPVRIAHAHTSFNRRYNPLAKIYVNFLKRQINKYSTDTVGCSQKAAETLFGEAANTKIIYNAVDEKFLSETGLHTENPAPVLLQVGMICDNKNQSFTVDVFHELLKYYSEARLILIGAPKDAAMQKYFEALKEKIELLSVEDSVSIIKTTDTLKEMNIADYIVFPSKSEGLGIVPIEAQALGMRCFVSDTVPAEVDCGGCTFLNLDSGAKLWAEKIAQQFEADGGKRSAFDISKFLPADVMEEYRKLYKGE